MNSTSPIDCRALARSILGDDFISAHEIETARGLVYTDDQLTELVNKIPERHILEQLRDSDMMLVAGPPTAMSLIDVRAVHAELFFAEGPDRNDKAWYDESKQKFAKADKVEALCWIALRKEPVGHSLSKKWSEQQALVKKPMIIPNVAEVVWALTTYKAVRDVSLLEDLYIRTSSVDVNGDHVSVGGFDSTGLDVTYFWDGNCKSSLGVSASQKF